MFLGQTFVCTLFEGHLESLVCGCFLPKGFRGFQWKIQTPRLDTEVFGGLKASLFEGPKSMGNVCIGGTAWPNVI